MGNRGKKEAGSAKWQNIWRVSKKASLEGKQAAIKTREKQGGSPSAKGRAQLLRENRQ